jgi:hypothetical protein
MARPAQGADACRGGWSAGITRCYARLDPGQTGVKAGDPQSPCIARLVACAWAKGASDEDAKGAVTDLEGLTRLWEVHPGAIWDVLALHKRSARGR